MTTVATCLRYMAPHVGALAFVKAAAAGTTAIGDTAEAQSASKAPARQG